VTATLRSTMAFYMLQICIIPGANLTANRAFEFRLPAIIATTMCPHMLNQVLLVLQNKRAYLTFGRCCVNIALVCFIMVSGIESLLRVTQFANDLGLFVVHYFAVLAGTNMGMKN